MAFRRRSGRKPAPGRKRFFRRRPLKGRRPGTLRKSVRTFRAVPQISPNQSITLAKTTRNYRSHNQRQISSQALVNDELNSFSKSFKKGAGKALGLASVQTALSAASMVASKILPAVLNTEMKCYIPTGNINGAFTSHTPTRANSYYGLVPYNYLMTGMAVGDGHGDRDGASIRVRQLKVKGFLDWNPSSTSAVEYVWVGLVLHKNIKSPLDLDTIEDSPPVAYSSSFAWETGHKFLQNTPIESVDGGASTRYIPRSGEIYRLKVDTDYNDTFYPTIAVDPKQNPYRVICGKWIRMENPNYNVKNPIISNIDQTTGEVTYQETHPMNSITPFELNPSVDIITKYFGTGLRELSENIPSFVFYRAYFTKHPDNDVSTEANLVTNLTPAMDLTNPPAINFQLETRFLDN